MRLNDQVIKVHSPKRGVHADPQHDGAGDHDVHQRTSNGDQQFLHRVARDPREHRHAADGKQDDLFHRDSKALRDERVTKLMEDHAEKEQEYQRDAEEHPAQSETTPLGGAQDDDDEERDVNPEVYVGDARKPEGPSHGRSVAGL